MNFHSPPSSSPAPFILFIQVGTRWCQPKRGCVGRSCFNHIELEYRKSISANALVQQDFFGVRRHPLQKRSRHGQNVLPASPCQDSQRNAHVAPSPAHHKTSFFFISCNHHFAPGTTSPGRIMRILRVSSCSSTAKYHLLSGRDPTSPTVSSSTRPIGITSLPSRTRLNETAG